MLSNRKIEVVPVASALGAEIHGVDLSEELSGAETATIGDAFARYDVIFFRDQSLTPEQHVAFARRWGEIEINRFFRPVEGHPMIAEVRKEPHQKQNIGSVWHTDAPNRSLYLAFTPLCYLWLRVQGLSLGA